jgi:tubulin polyglutamylase TTLL6/13
MHLTNYAINKHNENYVYNENAEDNDIGHKRSLKAVFEYLKEEENHNTGRLWDEIKDIIVKTLITANPMLNHLYKSC